MQIDVGACIAELLYEHPSVTIPGLGAFVSNYKPANIDQVEGKIAPPAKQISFNKNLLIDDGLLVKQLREKYRLSYGEAMRSVDNYAKEVKEKIENREIVTFASVGRLYKDYEQNYQFLPDETNFNADSYGLPTLEYYPVVRTAQEKMQAVSANKMPPPVKIQKKNWVQRNLLLVSSIGAFVIAGGVYVVLQNPKTTQQQEEAAPSATTNRVNVSPGDNQEADVEEVKVQDADDSESEGATLQPGTKSAIISIGIFSKKENVERLIKKIYEAGYEPYTEKVGSNTRVGIQTKYEKSAELSKLVETVGKEFNTKAAIYKK